MWSVLLFAAVALALFWINRPHKLIIDAALPAGFPQQAFSHQSFEELLQIYVAEGRVDYARWHQSPESIRQLDSYLAAVSMYSPERAPERFASRNDELAYWIYGYNAYVIKAVLDHWPVESVTDIKAPLEAVKGLGFFYQQRFSFGGKFMSLLAVESHEIRDKFRDPRIHFVLNCASESCPVARPDLPVGEELESLLTEAAIDFINDPANVSVDHAEKTLYLSTIFKWYKNDFAHELRVQGKQTDNSLQDYVAQYASGDLANDLTQAANYEIQFQDYGWALNSSH